MKHWGSHLQWCLIFCPVHHTARTQSVSWVRPYTNNLSWIKGLTSRKPLINWLLLLLAHQAAKHSDNASISLDQTFHSYPTSELLFLLGPSLGEQIFPPADSSLTAMCNRENNLTWSPPEAIWSLFNTSQHSQSSNAAEGVQIFLFIKSSKSKQSSFAQARHKHSTLPAGNHSLADTTSLKNIISLLKDLSTLITTSTWKILSKRSWQSRQSFLDLEGFGQHKQQVFHSLSFILTHLRTVLSV